MLIVGFVEEFMDFLPKRHPGHADRDEMINEE